MISSTSHSRAFTPPTPTFSTIREWTVEQVSQWLRDANLTQHVELFSKNHINGDALLQIDQSHLKEMGITSVGERVRLNGAIRQLHKRSADAENRARMAMHEFSNKSLTHDGLWERTRMPMGQPTWRRRIDESGPNIVLSTPSAEPMNPVYTNMQQNSYLGTRPSTATAVLSHPYNGSPSPVQRPSTSSGIVWQNQGVMPMRVPSGATSGAPSGAPSTSPRSAFQATTPSIPSPISSVATPVPTVLTPTVPPPPQQRGAVSPVMRNAISSPFNPRPLESDSQTTPPGTAGLSVNRPNLEDIKKRTIKFIDHLDSSRMIKIGDIRDAPTLLSRVLGKFGKPQSGNIYAYGAAAFGSAEARLAGGPWAVAMRLKPTPTLLSDSELIAVCRKPQAYDSVWHNGLYLCPLTDVKQAPWISEISEENDQTIGSVTTGGTTLRRASTLSILSGLGMDGVESNGGIPTFLLPPTEPPTDKTQNTKNVVRDTTRQFHLPAVRRRARNFFGHRPSSVVISSNLPVFFPRTEVHLLEQHANSEDSLSRRTSASNLSLLPVDDTGDDSGLVRRSSMMTTRSKQSSHVSDSRDSSSLLTVDEITRELSENDSPDDSIDSSVCIVDGEGTPIPLVSQKSAAKLRERQDTLETVSPSANPISPTTPVAPTGQSVMQSEEDVAQMRWHKGALIGAGSFGRVFLGMNAATGLLMAVKQVELPPEGSTNSQKRQETLESLKSEIELLKTLEHPNIVQYLGSFSDGQHLNIFLEYVPGGSVAALLRNYGAFEEQLVQNFIRQVLHGLNFLHSKGIIHRDIKGANILVDNKGGVKISDFGISKKVEHGLLLNSRANRPSLQGSVFWMAPEVVKQTTYTRKADIWSVGCLVVEMISGTHPWPTLDQMQAIFRIGSQASPPLPEELSENAAGFVAQTFEQDYTRRPTAAQLLEHPFMKDVGRAI
ncbi:mitogen-activated protein kinase kinase kinase [Malassezia cuniculi]|uniref:Mitogen-activated protein kinase kinase kinase n=1 Tax=Malassezia cuniculi TaxID=948313 RepID=A0AAF0ES56_9BASI|nr:mitogen-activated protein kinase kinase kinase [Malassezia cuniculi]